MRQKVVIRVLGPSSELLGWAEVHLVPCRGVLALERDLAIVIDVAGHASSIVAHACDLDVRIRLRHALQEVPALGAGCRLMLPAGTVILRIDTDETVPLPPVTVRQVVTLGPAPAEGVGAGQ